MANKLQNSRQHAFSRQGGHCYYCNLRMWQHGQDGPRQLLCTAEHLTARSNGGRDERTNIVAACLHCNTTRHKRKRPPEPERYRARVRRRVERESWLPAHVLAWGRG